MSSVGAPRSKSGYAAQPHRLDPRGCGWNAFPWPFGPELEELLVPVPVWPAATAITPAALYVSYCSLFHGFCPLDAVARNGEAFAVDDEDSWF